MHAIAKPQRCLVDTKPDGVFAAGQWCIAAGTGIDRAIGAGASARCQFGARAATGIEAMLRSQGIQRGLIFAEMCGLVARHFVPVQTVAFELFPDLRFGPGDTRSEEHTSELQSLMRISYAVFCLKKKKKTAAI